MAYSKKAISSFILGFVFLLIYLFRSEFGLHFLFGIIGWFLFYIGGITGVILGIKALKETKNSQIQGRWMAVFGEIFSYLVLILITIDIIANSKPIIL